MLFRSEHSPDTIVVETQEIRGAAEVAYEADYIFCHQGKPANERSILATDGIMEAS